MEIITTIIQTPHDLVRTAGAVSLLLVALHLLPRLWARRSRLTLPAALSLGGIPALALPALAAASPHRTEPAPIAEISPALDERVPPPRSLVGAGDASTTAPVHPAIHRVRAADHRERLFPRHSPPAERHLEPWERGVRDLRRVRRAGIETAPRLHASRGSDGSHYVVVPGDTLWGIAEKVLGTDDLRAIARFWPLIHRENRDVIGRDPNLIRPGQVLSLPPTDNE